MDSKERVAQVIATILLVAIMAIAGIGLIMSFTVCPWPICILMVVAVVMIELLITMAIKMIWET